MREVISGCYKKTIETTGISEFEHPAKLYTQESIYIISNGNNFKAVKTTAIWQRAEDEKN